MMPNIVRFLSWPDGRYEGETPNNWQESIRDYCTQGDNRSQGKILQKLYTERLWVSMDQA